MKTLFMVLFICCVCMYLFLRLAAIKIPKIGQKIDLLTIVFAVLCCLFYIVSVIFLMLGN